MRNEILILSAAVPNAYFLGPMGDSDPSDFIPKFWFIGLPRCNCTIRDICATADSLAQVLYNIPTVYFATSSVCFPSPFFLSQLQTADAVIAEASNPSRSSIPTSRRPSDLRQIQTNFRPRWQPLTTSLWYISKFPFSEYPPLPHIFSFLEFILSDF